MIYLTRQEQRIVILLGIVMLLGVGLLLVKRFQPGWVMRLSMGEPDFDIAKDEVSPRLQASSPTQEQGSEENDTDASAAGTPIHQQEQGTQAEQGNGSNMPVSTQQSTQKPKSDQPDNSQETDTSARININTATAAQLETLSGIGPVLAQRVIDYREKHDSFKNIREITAVRGIGDATLQEFKDHITVGENNSLE